MKNLTLYLRHKRLDQNKTLKNVAVSLGISTGSYANKEKGITQFYVDEVKNLCKILNISKDEMLNVFFS